MIVHDAASGADTVSFSILEPTPLIIDSIVIYQNVSCYGGNDGSACFLHRVELLHIRIPWDPSLFPAMLP